MDKIALDTPATEAFAVTDAGRFLLNALQYLEMANLVIETDAFRQQPSRYNRPLLNTLATGIELALKSFPAQEGENLQQIARKGHKIWKIWQEFPPDCLVKQLIFEAALYTYNNAVTHGLAQQRENTNVLWDEFEEQLKCLSDGYSCRTFPFRYPDHDSRKIPRPGWLTETFRRGTHKYCRTLLGVP